MWRTIECGVRLSQGVEMSRADCCVEALSFAQGMLGEAQFRTAYVHSSNWTRHCAPWHWRGYLRALAEAGSRSRGSIIVAMELFALTRSLVAPMSLAVCNPCMRRPRTLSTPGVCLRVPKHLSDPLRTGCGRIVVWCPHLASVVAMLTLLLLHTDGGC